MAIPLKALAGTAASSGSVTAGSTIAAFIIAWWAPDATATQAIALAAVINLVLAPVTTFFSVYLTKLETPANGG